MAQRVTPPKSSYSFYCNYRQEAFELTCEYMTEIGERAGLTPSCALDFATKAATVYYPEKLKTPKSKGRIDTRRDTTTATFDQSGRMNGLVWSAETSASTWPYFHRTRRFLRSHRPGEAAGMHRPQQIFHVAFLEGSDLARTLVNHGLQGAEEKQPAVVQTVDSRIIAMLDDVGMRPSTAVEPAPLVPEYPEINLVQLYHNSARRVSALLVAGAPASGF